MAITRAQIARELYIKGGVVNPDGRRGFGGGADMGTVSGTTPGSSANKGLSGGYQGGPKGGYGDAGSDDKPSKEVREKEKEKYEKQFFDKGKVPPLGSRPTSLSTKLKQLNLQKRLNYINYLQGNFKNKINKGLIDYQTEFGPLTNIADFSTLEDYIDEVQSVKDLVNKGFYSKDGRFAKGAIPDFSTKTGYPTADILGEIFGGPITSDRLRELNEQFKTLEGLKTTSGLEGVTMNELMKEYQPNRFKLMNQPDRDGPGQNDPCKGPNPPAYCFIGGKANDTMPEEPDPTFFRIMADGGMTNDAPMAQGGGITDLALRDEFFLGGVVKGIKKGIKGVTRAVKKIAKSPIGKAALFAGVAGIPFGGGSFFGSGSLFGKASGLLKSKGLKNFFLKNADKGFSLGNLSTAGIVTPLLAAPFIGELLGLNEQKQEEEMYAGPGVDFNAQPYYRFAADGGRIGYAGGTIPSFREYLKKEGLNLDELDANTFSIMQRAYDRDYPDRPNKLAEGGKPEPVAKKTMPLLDMGGKEKDYRETGGFVDMGRMEKADDVPARLSKNEFVFTAEAVRNAGDGDVDKGSEVMYNMMKNLESGGDVSEESQGLDGAREMFQTSQRLGEVI